MKLLRLQVLRPPVIIVGIVISASSSVDITRFREVSLAIDRKRVNIICLQDLLLLYKGGK